MFVNARATFLAVFVAGFALCTRGIGQAPAHGWLQPVGIQGYLFCGLALVLGPSVLFRVRVPPIRSDHAALVVLLGIIVVKVVLAFFYALQRAQPATGAAQPLSLPDTFMNS